MLGLLRRMNVKAYPATARIAVLALAGLLFCSAGTAAEPQPARSAPDPNPRLGMNLNGPADWNTELPFVDVFRLSRRWISQRKGESWGKGPELDLDKHGWVRRLAPDCWAETPLCTIERGHYPAGQYTVLYEGRGEIDFWGAASVAAREPGRMTIDVDPSRGGLFLRLKETDPDDYVRNIRVIMPGFENTYLENPFHPAFLERWQGVACFRFMDWMHTNGSTIETWADRPTPESATFTGRGVALEVMIDLCNRQRADAWFCMPHLADDDFVRRFAEMVKDRLHLDLKVYVEYSNEVWNNQFPQTRYSWEMAKKLGLGPEERPWEGGGMFYARRSVEMFKIWAEIFGGTERLVRVIAWQAGNTHWMDKIVLPFEDAYKHTDSLSIAPYISMNVPESGKELTADEVARWPLDRVLDHMEQHSLPRAIKAIEASKAIADKYGFSLTAYEGGQHMVGVAGGQDNETMNALFHEANRHPRMGEIYRRYYEAWTAAGGDLFCYFSSVGRWSKWGSWGIMEYYDDDPRQSPKFLATMRWARQRGQAVRLPE
ncbi:MAG: hypothetical protein RBS80_15570 [Thermoguttaceae bacterium]|nr:hypothetical protein [Thermoguttaceae bacterium]